MKFVNISTWNIPSCTCSCYFLFFHLLCFTYSDFNASSCFCRCHSAASKRFSKIYNWFTYLFTV